MAAKANLLEKLQEAIKACEEIPVKELNAQKQQIMEQFKELQKSVFEIVDEKTLILSNLGWKRKEKSVGITVGFEEVLKSEAKRIALKYGYNEETVLKMLQIQNEYNHREGYYLTRSEYIYWTLE